MHLAKSIVLPFSRSFTKIAAGQAKSASPPPPPSPLPTAKQIVAAVAAIPSKGGLHNTCAKYFYLTILCLLSWVLLAALKVVSEQSTTLTSTNSIAAILSR
ncbi:hypothetical protein HGRIS_001302 [Hohenbuehelia grisea]|uniref:Uncharacterized protein n=1 Tax=Hohenbuehelia grisea TaxID=104357 RepID=A0ABR3JNW8_9AGAR